MTILLGDLDVAAEFDMKAIQYDDYERWDIFMRDCYGNLWDGALTQNHGSVAVFHEWSLWSPPVCITFVDGPTVTTMGDGRLSLPQKARIRRRT